MIRLIEIDDRRIAVLDATMEDSDLAAGIEATRLIMEEYHDAMATLRELVHGEADADG